MKFPDSPDLLAIKSNLMSLSPKIISRLDSPGVLLLMPVSSGSALLWFYEAAINSPIVMAKLNSMFA